MTAGLNTAKDSNGKRSTIISKVIRVKNTRMETFPQHSLVQRDILSCLSGSQNIANLGGSTQVYMS
jgi:hypothetical protein